MVPTQWMGMVTAMMAAYGVAALIGLWVRSRRERSANHEIR